MSDIEELKAELQSTQISVEALEAVVNALLKTVGTTVAFDENLVETMENHRTEMMGTRSDEIEAFEERCRELIR